MSAPEKMVVFNDGSRVPYEIFHRVCEAGEFLVTSNNIYTLHALVRKCQDANFKLFPNKQADPETILKAYKLLDESSNVYENVRTIVLHSIEEYGNSLTIYVPIQGQVAEVKITKK